MKMQRVKGDELHEDFTDLRKWCIKWNDCTEDQKGRNSEGYDAVSDAYSYSQLSEVVDEFDVVLVAPQMKFNEDMIRDICAVHHKPYAVLDNFVYSTLDGEKGFDTVLSLLNE